MSVESAETSSCSGSGAWASRFRCLWTVHRCAGTSGHSAASARSSPAAPSTIRNSGVRRPRATRPSRTARQAASPSPPMSLTASSAFWPSRRTPRTTSRETLVAFRSTRTRTTVPSRISRTTPSPARSRRHQASQSAFSLRQVRLTTSLPTAPRNSAARARWEQRGQGSLYPARVGAREVGARDQGLDLASPPRVARQGGAAPLPGRAALGPQPGARHGDRHRPEGAGQPPLAVAVPVPRGGAAPVPPSPQGRGQLLLEQLLDEAADPLPQARLDRVEPGLPGEQGRLGRPLGAILVHGVVSAGVPPPVMAR